jgi:hypothetical protein
MKSFQTSISQIYQKILFPYFYHKYLGTHASTTYRGLLRNFFKKIIIRGGYLHLCRSLTEAQLPALALCGVYYLQITKLKAFRIFSVYSMPAMANPNRLEGHISVKSPF